MALEEFEYYTQVIYASIMVLLHHFLKLENSNLHLLE